MTVQQTDPYIPPHPAKPNQTQKNRLSWPIQSQKRINYLTMRTCQHPYTIRMQKSINQIILIDLICPDISITFKARQISVPIICTQDKITSYIVKLKIRDSFDWVRPSEGSQLKVHYYTDKCWRGIRSNVFARMQNKSKITTQIILLFFLYKSNV